MTDKMTTDHEAPTDDEQNERASSSQPMLPFDPQSLVSMRVRPAQFSRMCQVSKQAVSDWIKRGVVTLGPDGLLDPIVASRQVFENTNPDRLRARMFKGLARDVPELQEKNRELKVELRAARVQLKESDAARAALAVALDQALKTRLHPDDVSERLSEFINATVNEFDKLSVAHAAGTLDAALDRLSASVFYRFTAEDMEGIYDAD